MPKMSERVSMLCVSVGENITLDFVLVAAGGVSLLDSDLAGTRWDTYKTVLSVCVVLGGKENDHVYEKESQRTKGDRRFYVIIIFTV